jgi:uncharacterized membrane protein YdbT with pleckstrin-like domain
MTDAALDSFRPSTTGWLKGTLAGWGTVLLLIAGVVLWIMDVAGLGMYWLVLSVVAVGLFLWRWFQNLASRYELTEQRLIIRRGLVAKSVDEIELYRIKDVRINFSLINQIAGIGTISIASSDETTRGGDLVIRDVEKAQERRETLRRLVDAARQKRLVREVDMVHEQLP